MAIATHCNLSPLDVARVFWSFWALVTRRIMHQPTNSTLTAGASLNDPPERHTFSLNFRMTFLVVTVSPAIMTFLVVIFNKFTSMIALSGVIRPLHRHLRSFTTSMTLCPVMGPLCHLPPPSLRGFRAGLRRLYQHYRKRRGAVVRPNTYHTVAHADNPRGELFYTRA